eukprot:Phypoly_transcript_12361.p1 GENE.Phypoly_transcript_12361~~Phypoly_transcript_12361.p1  ORF type:complete len:334 (+),score=90.56 Phypoly_transcript_12361:90-1004(+)
MDGSNPAHGAMFGPDEMENPNDTPTVAEYKKLKRVMRIMIKFYEDGSNAKLDQANDMEYELQKVETDLRMVDKQLEVLRTFPIHPKRTTYEKELVEEQEKLKKLQDDFSKKLAEFKALYHWSLGIVDVTKWLASGLDDYCVNFLKLELDIVPKPLERPTKETFDKYKQGLEEVHTNLSESQDFFQASLDGRLKKYHTMEKEIIEGQLKALEEFPPMNARKAHWDEELQKDLEFVKENMTENPASNQKKERMLSMHRDFVNTLSWFKGRLDTFAQELGIEAKENGTMHHIPSTSEKVSYVTKMEA